jgi:hypothetical protein
MPSPGCASGAGLAKNQRMVALFVGGPRYGTDMDPGSVLKARADHVYPFFEEPTARPVRCFPVS